MPTTTNTCVANDKEGYLKKGSGNCDGSPRTNVQSSGTITPSTTKSWLPVPFKPTVSQHISTRACLAGITAILGKPLLSAPCCGVIPTPTTSAPMHPLENFQRPRTSTPPSLISAGCGGKIPPANTVSGSVLKIFANVASGKLPK